VIKQLYHFGLGSLLAANGLRKLEDVIWLIGDARSGTTWVANLLNHRGNYREMFEPFHPTLVPAAQFLDRCQYVRPGQDWPELERLSTRIFSGSFHYRRVDKGVRLKAYQGLLVKDICANLFAHWAATKFPQVRTVLLIRNPFAVAASKLEKSDWNWFDQPAQLLDQPELHDDFLYPHAELIRETAARRDPLLINILIWSILNSIPLRQFGDTELQTIFYEDAFRDPSEMVASVLRMPQSELDPSIVKRPSKVAGQNILRGNCPLTSWKNKFDDSQVREGNRILEHFGLNRLYSASGMPDRAALNEFRRRNPSPLAGEASPPRSSSRAA
jgi:hypothetical protein